MTFGGQGVDATGAAERRLVIIGVLLMLTAGFNSSLLHLGVRYVGNELPPVQVVFLRTMFSLLLTAPFVFGSGAVAWRTNNLPLQIVRGFVGVVSTVAWYYALANMPLADAAVLSFTTPIFVTIGAAFYFSETVGRVRSTAVILGLLGAVVILKPGIEAISLAALAALFSNILWAVGQLMAKQLIRYDSPITVAFYQPLMIAPLAGLATIPVWVMPSATMWMALIGMGGVAAIGNYCFVRALKMIDASILMPIDYVRLLWMVMWGYVVFKEIPGWSTWLGAAMIVGSTLYVTWHEARAPIAPKGRA